MAQIAYPEYSVPQGNHYKYHSIAQSYNPQVQNQPRPRQPNENPKDYMLTTYTGVELVFEINAATAIYRLDPFVKYLCAWKMDAAPEELQAIQSRTQWRHPNLVSFLFLDQPLGKGVRIFYEYLALDVKKLIEKRSQSNSYIPEQELWKCLQGLCSAFLFLQKKGIHHGALSLESVFFDEEYLLYRIQDVSPFRVKAPNLFINPYPAPELNDSPVQQNKFKVDVFGLGIIILQMMLLKDLGSMMFIKGLVNQSAIIQAQEKCAGLYSPKILNVINQLLQFNPNSRPDWQTLAQILEENGSEAAKPMMRSSSNVKISTQECLTTESKTMDRRNTEGKVQANNYNATKPKISKIDEKLQQLSNKIQETLAKSQNKQLRS